MRCDLHVHSRRSGASDLPLVGWLAQESYSEPRAVYERARERGMDLVTLTDHDTIDGALEIASLPGTFLSEELTCRLPGGRCLHLGVFDITPADHVEMHRRQDDAEALFACLAERRIPFCLNHPFSALTGARRREDLWGALPVVPLLETRNGMMSARVNALAARAARRSGASPVAGSDAHTLASVALAYTMVPSARTRDEFLQGLRRGLTFPAGSAGSYRRLTADVARIVAGAYRAKLGPGARSLAALAGSLVVAPLLPLLPLVTAATYVHEQWFATRLARELGLRDVARRRPAASGPFGPAAAAPVAR